MVSHDCSVKIKAFTRATSGHPLKGGSLPHGTLLPPAAAPSSGSVSAISYLPTLRPQARASHPHPHRVFNTPAPAHSTHGLRLPVVYRSVMAASPPPGLSGMPPNLGSRTGLIHHRDEAHATSNHPHDGPEFTTVNSPPPVTVLVQCRHVVMNKKKQVHSLFSPPLKAQSILKFPRSAFNRLSLSSLISARSSHSVRPSLFHSPFTQSLARPARRPSPDKMQVSVPGLSIANAVNTDRKIDVYSEALSFPRSYNYL